MNLIAEPISRKKPKTTKPPSISFALCEGDGIGPEISGAVMRILKASGLKLNPVTVQMGEELYKSGNNSGIDDKAWEALAHNRVLLKAPITTPRGKGYKSLNVTLRKTFGLFANIRPVRSFSGIIEAPALDMVIVRENEEDTYAGIEHRQTAEVTQCLKLITQPGSDRIIDYAFRLAENLGREKVTLMTKDNIMKITDGLFSQRYNQIKDKYPHIIAENMIVDIGAARLAARPSDFDIVLAQNLYGDILSDIAAEVAGSVGLCGSANVGNDFAMFEAIHGSAPDIAGQNIANPSGLLKAACMMLGYLGQGTVAEMIENAWLKALEDGYRTKDIFGGKPNEILCTTDQFASAIIERFEQQPGTLNLAEPFNLPPANNAEILRIEKPVKELSGVDVFLDWDEQGRDANLLAAELKEIISDQWGLSLITNRGVKVYPHGNPATFKTDHWRCRFLFAGEPGYMSIVQLLQSLGEASFDVIKTENLYHFDGKPGYSMGQGE